MASIDTKEDGIQFSHTLDAQLRGQLQAGLSFRDMYEDYNGEGRLDQLRIPTFWATCAEKPAAR
ncbi:methyltransferase [Lacticaseibacillus camelliae]|nr:methyltransferase [Lacticaseibacillus camelliae]